MRQVVCAPGSAVSAVQVAAYKKLVLVHVLLTGKVRSAPRLPAGHRTSTADPPPAELLHPARRHPAHAARHQLALQGVHRPRVRRRAPRRLRRARGRLGRRRDVAGGASRAEQRAVREEG